VTDQWEKISERGRKPTKLREIKRGDGLIMSSMRNPSLGLKSLKKESLS